MPRRTRVRTGRNVTLTFALLIVALLVAGFLWVSGFVPFRTIPLQTDPIYWVTPEAIKFGVLSTPSLTGPDYVEFHFSPPKEYPLVPKPTEIKLYQDLWFTKIQFSVTPSKWDLSPIQTESQAGYIRTYYGFNIDIDDIDRGAPDIGVIITHNYNIYQYNPSVADYTVLVYVCAQGSSEQSSNSEYWFAFKDTYFVLLVDPYYLLTKLEIDGREIIPSQEVPRTGAYKWIVPVASKAPSDPLASTLTFFERLWPWGVGSKCITSISRARVHVDRNVPVHTAQYTVFNPTVTVTGVTTVTVQNPTTVTYTQWHTVTKTESYVSQVLVYKTTSGTVVWTVTTTIQGPTITIEKPTPAMTVTETLKPGDVRTITTAYTTTIRIEETRTTTMKETEIIKEVVEAIQEVVKTVPTWMWIVIILIAFVFVVASFFAGRQTGRGRVAHRSYRPYRHRAGGV
ncbi:MAG: hypothetical protein QXH59_09720 [Candidatus Caldarchaeum sp.]